MLALKRRDGERILIGRDIIVELSRSRRGSAHICIDAPRTIPIVREELTNTAAAFSALEHAVEKRAMEAV